MSRTVYGHWRYLFVPQRKFEASITGGAKSLAELGASLVVPRPEPQLRLIPLEDVRVKREAFKTLLPLYSLKAAAGHFGKGEPVEPEAWVEAAGIGTLDPEMFLARAVGRSMEPTIHDGDLLVFRANPAGTRQGKIVLAQYRGSADRETGGSFTVKRYSSEKRAAEEGEWRHSRIVLSSLNKDFAPIAIPAEAADDFRIVAEFIAVLRAQPGGTPWRRHLMRYSNRTLRIGDERHAADAQEPSKRHLRESKARANRAHAAAEAARRRSVAPLVHSGDATRTGRGRSRFSSHSPEGFRVPA